MEFSIDIHTTLNGEIIIEDFSKEYGQYINEDVEIITSYDSYKYSESSTLNTIMKVNTCKIELIDVLLSEHNEYLDSNTFNIENDGLYTIEHVILPNLKWLENSSEEYLKYYETIYITDNEKVYKLLNGKLEECSIKEIIERNIEGTTIKKCKVNVFFTGNLQQCYINNCKQLFNNLLTECSNKKVDTFSRDFVWMTLNIIDYLIGFNQFMEAQRLLELFEKCGGFCNQPSKQNILSCGCSKT